jgi:hypothetical protein
VTQQKTRSAGRIMQFPQQHNVTVKYDVQGKVLIRKSHQTILIKRLPSNNYFFCDEKDNNYQLTRNQDFHKHGSLIEWGRREEASQKLR